jgi:hypothetical protein
MTKKQLQNTKPESWDGEEVHCRNCLAMVSEKHQPSQLLSDIVNIQRDLRCETIAGSPELQSHKGAIHRRRVKNGDVPNPWVLSS